MSSESQITAVYNGLIDDFMEQSGFFKNWNVLSVDAGRAEKFLISFDFLVKSFPNLIAAGAAGLEDAEARTVLAVNLFQECGEGDVRRSHHAIYRKFLATAGVSVPAVPETPWAGEWKAGLMEILQGASSPRILLGALSAGEFLAQPALFRIYAVLRPLYPGADMEYFTSHLDLEAKHVEDLAAAAARQIRGEEEGEEAAAGFKLGLAVWENYFNELDAFLFGAGVVSRSPRI